MIEFAIKVSIFIKIKMIIRLSAVSRDHWKSSDERVETKKRERYRGRDEREMRELKKKLKIIYIN